eukprot:13654799-Ditylum_brightwellii.AAC.1
MAREPSATHDCPNEHSPQTGLAFTSIPTAYHSLDTRIRSCSVVTRRWSISSPPRQRHADPR